MSDGFTFLDIAEIILFGGMIGAVVALLIYTFLVAIIIGKGDPQ